MLSHAKKDTAANCSGDADRVKYGHWRYKIISNAGGDGFISQCGLEQYANIIIRRLAMYGWPSAALQED